MSKTLEQKIIGGLAKALQTSVITLGLVFVLYHSIQFIEVWLEALRILGEVL